MDLGKKLLEAARQGQDDEVRLLMANGAPFTTDWVRPGWESQRGGEEGKIGTAGLYISGDKMEKGYLKRSRPATEEGNKDEETRHGSAKEPEGNQG